MIKFYKCEHCGNVATKLLDKLAPLVCCGQPMAELVANTVDAAQEKHVPSVVVSGNEVEVNVGSVEHPMTEMHLINFVAIETSHGYKIAELKEGNKPQVKFYLTENEKLIATYAYCNLHGIWKA